MNDLRVYLIDDHSMIRAGFRSLLQARDGIEVVGDHDDARKAVDEIADLRPDIVLLDITMPGISGLDAIGLIRGKVPRTKIIMLTHHEGQRFVSEALKAGADGYLSKDSDEAELELAVRAVQRGDSYLTPRVAGNLLNQIRSGEAEPTRSPIERLTPREREVFQLLALGHSNKEVASELKMSLGTAKKHRENLQRKLDCHSAAELARLAIREGLLSS